MNEKMKKVLDIGTKVVTWVLIAFTVFMMLFTIITVATVDRNDRPIFGMKFYIVQSDSMSKSELNKDLDVHFNAGDIIFVKSLSEKEKRELQSDQIIAFMSTGRDNYGDTVTHMIRERKYENGEFVGYVTYGTNTGENDETLVDPAYVLGTYSGKLPGLGHFFAFVKSTPGYIICILIPFLLLILYNGGNVIRLFRKYKQEQMAAMEAERAKIEEERAENQRMMAELMALRARLEAEADKKSDGDSPEDKT